MSHFKEVCYECRTIIRQCRCPDLNKKEILKLCADCKVSGGHGGGPR